MAIKHLKDGQDFGPEHFSRDFGFRESAGGAKPPFAGDKDTRGPKHVAEPEEGGEHGGDFAHGGPIHPHGHSVVRVSHEEDGRVVMHHAHGGQSVTHLDGRVTHHHHDGAPAGMAHMGVEGMHDESEYAHRGIAPDKPTVGPKHTPEPEEHGGGDFAQGGFAHMRPRLGRSMRPAAERNHSPIGHSPAPPRSQMGGQPLGMGVQQSSEPDPAPPGGDMGGGGGGGMPGLKKGGRKKHEE